jgi:DNA uptake protein ComE-like DNA-binding protein
MTQKILTAVLFVAVLILSICIVVIRNDNAPEIIPVISEESEVSDKVKTSKTTKTVTKKTTTTLPEIYHIELNTADYEDFLQLGLTPELAASCIELREKISYFSNVLELLYADGMTTPIYRRIDDYCYVDESFNPGVNYPNKG